MTGPAVKHHDRRLSVLRELAILDTPAEPAYDDIASLAAACCGSDIGAVNFVDDHRHWTKAIVGVEGGQGASVSAEVSFCAATVASDDGRITVPDTLAEPGWRDHPLVVAGPQVRFYAGVTIVVAGEPVGVVCVFGDEPRPIAPAEEQALAALARQASAQLELRRRNAELRELALCDALTGLANRTLLADHLDLALAQRERSGGEVAVLFCDVDDFKAVNDRLGHEAGDRLLVQIAERLREATRATDTVARIAGDEFVVVCAGLDTPSEAHEVVRRIGTLLEEHPTDPAAGLSIGCAVVGDGETAAEALRRADRAMYEAKRGRSRRRRPLVDG
jgi:diguanylate cyclase (GGDEF)-like protein